MNALDQMQRFSYQVDQLRQEPLVKSGWDNSFTINFNRTTGLSAAIQQPNEVALRSALLTLRKFVSQREEVFLDRIYNICEQHITSAELKAFLRDAREHWKKAQRSQGIAWTLNGKELTPAYVADLWINGHYLHSDAEKLRELEQLSSTGLGLERFTFVGFVGDVLRQVLYVDNVIRHALRDGCFKP
jgi:hypothetical protein